MTLKLIPEQYNIIWAASWISLYPCIEMCKRKRYDFAFFIGGVFLTSINYWYYPLDGWRRDLDIWMVRTGFVYMGYKSYLNRNYMWFLYGVPAASSYFIGKHFYQKDKLWTYTYFHMGVHLLGNMANFSSL
tara:strand:- start:946 stop:1338 length:393 start_codon:yes stop_codon:yes gene_type:complete